MSGLTHFIFHPTKSGFGRYIWHTLTETLSFAALFFLTTYYVRKHPLQ